MRANSILLVDDDPEIADMLRMLLEHAGYSVFVATTALEAIELWGARAEETGIFITDMELEDDLSGLDFAERFRAEKPELRTILMSGHPPCLIANGRCEGIEFLQKPFELGELISLVKDGCVQKAA